MKRVTSSNSEQRRGWDLSCLVAQYIITDQLIDQFLLINLVKMNFIGGNNA